ncbi:hypothetical protein ZOSMA_99G00810 [Zostera marina]|uniref:Uncharacterized protein n=1 Tax=Zostera marina TaxID=29655 RepID=A0A0K9NJL9_ZOSMR|nr:hypothetical protein ZOSMA_99G00810 [Zostera marina]
MMISRTWSSSHRSDLMAAQQPPHHQPAKKPAPSSSVSISAVSAPTSSSDKRLKATQSTLHDFSSFPVLKTWGLQRVLRCVKADDEDDHAASDRVSAGEEEVEEGEKKNENKKKKRKKKKKIKTTDSEDEMDQILAMSKRKIKPPLIQEKQEPGSGEKEVPWNLRTRRGCYSRPTVGRNPNSEDEGMYAGCSVRRRSEEDSEEERSGRSKMKMKKKTKFSVVLTKQEIEEDLYSMTGKRASKRPKKRPRALKTQLDQLYPGIYMSEVSPALYEVREPAAAPTE